MHRLDDQHHQHVHLHRLDDQQHQHVHLQRLDDQHILTSVMVDDDRSKTGHYATFKALESLINSRYSRMRDIPSALSGVG